MFILLFSLFASLISSSSAEDWCNYFKYCGGASQSAQRSLPSTTTSSSFNPSNIARVKGLGLETLYQPNNPLGFTLVTGTGKVGAAMISASAENSFFGNRAVEIDEVYLQRRIDKKRYDSKKISLAVGARVVNKKNFTFDAGVSLKRHPEIKKINPGFGFSGSISILNYGVSIYKDDVKLDFKQYLHPEIGIPYEYYYGSPTYQETFTVRSFSLGTKIKDLSLDVGFIRTKYDFYTEDTNIVIYSAAYNYSRMLFNLAYRHEQSPNLKEYHKGLVVDRNKRDVYAGVQYIFNEHVTFGVAYNNFLVKDFSTTLTLFL